MTHRIHLYKVSNTQILKLIEKQHALLKAHLIDTMSTATINSDASKLSRVEKEMHLSSHTSDRTFLMSKFRHARALLTITSSRELVGSCLLANLQQRDFFSFSLFAYSKAGSFSSLAVIERVVRLASFETVLVG